MEPQIQPRLLPWQLDRIIGCGAGVELIFYAAYKMNESMVKLDEGHWRWWWRLVCILRRQTHAVTVSTIKRLECSNSFSSGYFNLSSSIFTALISILRRILNDFTYTRTPLWSRSQILLLSLKIIRVKPLNNQLRRLNRFEWFVLWVFQIILIRTEYEMLCALVVESLSVANWGRAKQQNIHKPTYDARVCMRVCVNQRANKRHLFL